MHSKHSILSIAVTTCVFAVVASGQQIGTTGEGRRMEAIRLQLSADGTIRNVSDSGRASASQSAVLRVRRDVFRRGGWEFPWKRPTPYNDGYNYGDATLRLRLGDVIPAGSTVTSAVLKWNFSNLVANTGATYGQDLGGDAARSPRIYGSNQPCQSICTPATINRWAPDAAFWASRLELEGQSLYWFPGPPRQTSGSLDLLTIFPANALPGKTLNFVCTVQYGVGRPFFGTEGLNATTEFDVNGRADVDVSAVVSLTFIPPPPCNAPAITSQPRNTTIVSGQSATLSVAATGCSPLQYEWLDTQGRTIPNANSAVFVTPPLTADTSYSVRVSNTTGSTQSSSAFITVQPASTVSSVKVQTETICGSNPVQGTVTLTAPAPIGGLQVNLATDVGTASVPTTMTVSEGARSADFTITTYPVAAEVPVTISARHQDVVKTAVLKVGQNLASFSVTPSSVCGGRPATGKVTLFCSAPPAGLLLRIFSANPSVATAPAEITVAPNSTTADFEVRTDAVASDQETVVLTADLRGIRKEAKLSVTPPYTDITTQLKTSVGGFRFDRGSGRFRQSVDITNNSSAPISGPILFVLDGLASGVTLHTAAGESSCPDPAGSPYVLVKADTGILPGAVATVLLEFTNPGNVPITYRPRILARQ